MKERGTYNGFSLAAVVSFLQDGQQEIVKVELPLKREFVIGVENIECERSPWFIEGCGIPAYPQKLAILLNPFGVLRTRTELHVDVVGSVNVNYKNDSGL
jgi:hypothetical protein